MAGFVAQAYSAVLAYFAVPVYSAVLAGFVVSVEAVSLDGADLVACVGYLAGLAAYLDEKAGCLVERAGCLDAFRVDFLGCYILGDFQGYIRADTQADSRRAGCSQVCCRGMADGSWADDNPSCRHSQDDCPKVQVAGGTSN
jgi:hypothetical protein